MKKILAALLAAGSLGATQAPEAEQAFNYRFETVKRSVVVTHANAKSDAAKGSVAVSGDRVTTGWFSYALVAAEQHRARFELYSSSDVELASGTPGVVLTLNRGRIHAIFDKITGSEPRAVATPGALLAVRGTEFMVNVASNGDTSVDVFEGLVEISSPLRREPFFVRPGESSIFGRERPPAVFATPPERQREPHHEPFGPNDQPNRGPGGTMDGGRQPNGEPRPMGPSQPGSGMPHGGGPSMPSSPPPPPHGGH